MCGLQQPGDGECSELDDQGNEPARENRLARFGADEQGSRRAEDRDDRDARAGESEVRLHFFPEEIIRRYIPQKANPEPPRASRVRSQGEVPSRRSSQTPASVKRTRVMANCRPTPANSLPDMPLRVCMRRWYSASGSLRRSGGGVGCVRMASISRTKLELVKFFSSFRIPGRSKDVSKTVIGTRPLVTEVTTRASLAADTSC